MFSLNPSQNSTSIVLDFLRAGAALMVCVGHALGIFSFGLPTVYWPQQLGVVIFFLLSGYLISQTLHRRLQNSNSTFLDYAIDRWSRIYSGFLPAIALIAAIDWFAISFGHANVETVQRFTVETFFANVFMMQAPAIALPFGSAAPFWTVAIEFWMYIFVGLLAFAIRDGFSPWRIILIVVAGIIPVQSLTENNMVIVPWLLGAAIEQTAFRWQKGSLFWWCAVGAIAIAALGCSIFYGSDIYGWSTFTLSAIIFVAILSVVSRMKILPSQRFTAIVVWCAAWSYSLYLLHHTLMMDLAAFIGSSVKNAPLAIAISILVAITFASLTEFHHRMIALIIKGLIRRKTSTA